MPVASSSLRLTGGFFPGANHEGRRIYNLDAHDNTRRDMLVLLLRTLIDRKVPGAFAELGVYKGLTARLIHHYAPERTLHLFDTFEGFTKRSDLPELQQLAVHWREYRDPTFPQGLFPREHSSGIEHRNIRFRTSRRRPV
jgi:hypothetical protein